MRISYKNTLSDLIIFSTLHQALSPIVQAIFSMLAVLVGLSVVKHSYLAAVVLSIAAYAAFWVAQALFNALCVATRNNRTVLTEHILELLDDGLQEETAFNKSLHYWAGITGVAPRPGHVAIYVAPGVAHLVPNRAFASSGERLAFVQQVRAQVAAATA